MFLGWLGHPFFCLLASGREKGLAEPQSRKDLGQKRVLEAYAFLGFGLFAFGSLVLGFWFWVFAFGFLLLGFWLFAFGSLLLGFCFWLFGFGFWLFGFGSLVLGFGSLLLAFGFLRENSSACFGKTPLSAPLIGLNCNR